MSSSSSSWSCWRCRHTGERCIGLEDVYIERGEERRGNERVRLDLVVTYVESVVADLSCIFGLL